MKSFKTADEYILNASQREFADFISSAKMVETRKTRIKKIIPLIFENIGLNDKYRK